MLGDVLEVDYGYEDRLIARLDLRAIIAKSLSEREKRVLHARIHGSTLEETAELCGISRGRVWQIHTKAVRKLQWKATRKKQVPQPTKDFGEILKEYPPKAIPEVIPAPDISRSAYLTINMVTAEATRLWTNYNAILRHREEQAAAQGKQPWAYQPPPRAPDQPIPWAPGQLARDRIILSVYWGRGLIKRHHTETGAFAADVRDMMKIGDRIEVMADGVLTKLALRGDKWRLIEPSP